MPLSPFDALTDRIYEAAIVPGFWPNVLQAFCDVSDAFGGVLFAANSQYSGWVASPDMTAPFAEFVARGWAERNPRPGRAVQRKLTGFVGDRDLFSPEEMDADPTYEYLRSKGLGWCAGIVAPIPCGDIIVFSWERRYEAGPFDPETIQSFNGMASHLRRAALVAARLGLEKARTAAETMGALGLPAAVLSRSNQLLLTNDLFEKFVPSLFQDYTKRLVIRDVRADALLKNALDRTNADSSSFVQVLSVPIAARHDLPPMVVHIVPIRLAAQDVFSAAKCLIVITALTKEAGPDATLIQGLFDLTPAEARVAKAIAAGLQIREIAAIHEVSISTVQTQLKSVSAKTGTSRQSELVLLLSRATFA